MAHKIVKDSTEYVFTTVEYIQDYMDNKLKEVPKPDSGGTRIYNDYKIAKEKEKITATFTTSGGKDASQKYHEFKDAMKEGPHCTLYIDYTDATRQYYGCVKNVLGEFRAGEKQSMRFTFDFWRHTEVV